MAEVPGPFPTQPDGRHAKEIPAGPVKRAARDVLRTQHKDGTREEGLDHCRLCGCGREGSGAAERGLRGRDGGDEPPQQIQGLTEDEQHHRKGEPGDTQEGEGHRDLPES